MKREVIALTRMFVDSFPESIRNSYLLFRFAKIIFNLPYDLYHFRNNYDHGLYKDLSLFYDFESPYYLKRASNDTDINSRHINKILKLIKLKKPKNILDVGAGSGYLVNLINKEFPEIKITALDFNISDKLKKNKFIEYLEGDIKIIINNFMDSTFEFVICTHVLEHLPNPKGILFNLRRITSNNLVLICPLERKFKWGMNYHINFYPDEKTFYKFLDKKLSSKLIKKNYSNKFLGDLFYTEVY